MKFAEALDTIFKLPYLAISGECKLDEASEQVTRNPQIRGIYVVDNQERLQGYLSLGVLIRHVIASRHKPQFHVRSLLSMITAKKVADLMERDIVRAHAYDSVEGVLDTMVLRNIKQVPVVDEEHRIIAVVNILDLWNIIEK
jgi:CBS domain-containing protein